MITAYGYIINMTNYLPYFFRSNPAEVDSGKSINFFYAPNVGNSNKKAFYTGSENETISFQLTIVEPDGNTDLGVLNDVNYFKALREPSPTWSNILDINGSYPPAKILFGYGTGNFIPSIFIIEDIQIKTMNFLQNNLTGSLGIPRKAVIDISLSLDEDNIFNKANKYAMKVAALVASGQSLLRSSNV